MKATAEALDLSDAYELLCYACREFLEAAEVGNPVLQGRAHAELQRRLDKFTSLLELLSA